MTIGYKSLYINLEENIKKLISRNEDLKNEKNKLIEELNKAKQELMHAHKDIIELQSKYDNLRLAQSLNNKDSNEGEYSQKRLSKLVREIDICIALLNQQ